MKFIFTLILSRMRREKKRLLFVLLAIAASSCLIVWTIGGFNALFIDETVKEANYLGVYDLRVASESFGNVAPAGHGGGKFASPTSRRHYGLDAESNEKTKTNANSEQSSPNGAVETKSKADETAKSQADLATRHAAPSSRGRGRRGAAATAISAPLIQAIRQDENVALCDEVAPLRMYVYAPGTERAILQDDDPDASARPDVKRTLDAGEIADAPESVDPELHRKAFGAYRATMGTPMGLGSVFLATTAKEAPFELEDGRWFHVNGATPPREAVMTARGAKRYGAKVGDPLVLLGVALSATRVVEYQLEVVGIVDDPDVEGFYVSRALGEELAAATETPLATTALFLKLRSSVETFRSAWNAKLTSATPTLETATRDELARRYVEAIKNDQTFKLQATTGALLASLAALLIVFTALSMSVDEDRRLIAFYRVSGLTRGQISRAILVEGLILAIPGWLAGALAGWALVFVVSGKTTGLNFETIGFSFLCTVVGAILATMTPMIQSARIKPLEALGTRETARPYREARRRRTRSLVVMTLLGLTLIALDAALIRYSTIDTMKRAAVHSGVGVLALALGVALLVPLAIRITEALFLPIVAFILRFDPQILRHELSDRSGRVVAVAVAMSVGGGLFVTMQIWGYSMLAPFLPGRGAPDAFVAFLPTGLRPEMVDELKALPMVDPDRFVPVAVEQAAFAEGSVQVPAQKSQFANVVFFGVDVAKALEGKTPLIGMTFRQGKPEDAWGAMKSGRGVVVTDSLSVDYGLNLGDVLKVTHPREPEKVLEYPIVGVVAFDGWQWLSKTGGVRRNFGRSGGIVFAREGVVADDYGLERRSCFWFDQPGGAPVDYASTESACDRIALKNLKLDLADRGLTSPIDASQTAYVKLSTRESLMNSITERADSVIWGLSKTPLTTLAITAIAVVGVVANSVRSRRWQFGVMRAVGLTRGATTRLIGAEGLMIGIVASLASFLFGYLAAQGALKLGSSMFGTQDPPLILPTAKLLTGLALTLALCVAAALYPAIKTGRTEPLKLLQSGRAPD